MGCNCKDKAKRFVVTDEAGQCLMVDDTGQCLTFEAIQEASTAARTAALPGAWNVRPL